MKESTRVMLLRVVLGVWMLYTVFFTVTLLFFAQAMFESLVPGERFTSAAELLSLLAGTMTFTWAVAGWFAFRAPTQRLGLLKALAAAMGILGVVGLYADTVLAKLPFEQGPLWDILVLVLFAATVALYPRGQRES
ncbi:MAG: hypothetical protein HY687_06640 [Chloroflexi bacterium]|nr:hypothetical protein [Chloroflexota bacterium]